jgi:hypothetical protein
VIEKARLSGATEEYKRLHALNSEIFLFERDGGVYEREYKRYERTFRIKTLGTPPRSVDKDVWHTVEMLKQTEENDDA